ncbi:MAG TPA: CAP domain-containing protein [Solirubrobacteraceae bacterium]
MLVAGLLTCAGTLVVGPSTARARSGCANAQLRPDGRNASAIDAATLCLIDRVRAEHGLRAVRSNRQLGTVAASQVGSMLRWNYFADVRPSGQTPFALVILSPYRAHSASISVGQNIAWASGAYATPEHVVADWMASPPHRQIMLSGEFRDAGVAVSSALPSVLHAGRRGAVYAVEFGVRR